jgi:hypothetical protein
MCVNCENTPEKKIKLGRLFGYPQCCIDEFIYDSEKMKDTNIDVRIPEQIKIAKITGGFVPCKKHALAISSGEVTLESIIVGRDAKKVKKYVRNHQI